MYLAFGMTSEEYWKGTPRLATAYREKYELEQELKNEQLWLQGVYIYDALGAIVSRALATKKTPKREIHNYAEKPYRLKPYTAEELAKQKEDAAKRAIEELTAMKKAWDNSHGR